MKNLVTIKYNPQPDITAHELARILPLFFNVAFFGDTVAGRASDLVLPPECLRHFAISESTAPEGRKRWWRFWRSEDGGSS